MTVLLPWDPSVSEELHARCLYPAVRVRTSKALGSGTILFAESGAGAGYDAYVLTNHHVVADLIKVEKRWSTLLKRNVDMDVLGTPYIETFTYAYTSRDIGSTSFQGEIACYDKDEDLALLKFHSPHPVSYAAHLLPEDKVNELVSFMPVWNVGCGMGQKPVITIGFLSAFGCEIENKDYFMITAPSIFGNSGGATFTWTGELIGVPARITVVPLGFSADIVTHMGYSITVKRIYEFLRQQIFDFIINAERTSAQCAEERRQKRERDERRRAGEDND